MPNAARSRPRLRVTSSRTAHLPTSIEPVYEVSLGAPTVTAKSAAGVDPPFGRRRTAPEPAGRGRRGC